MTLLIKLIIITVIWVLGFKIVTSEGMLLESVGKYAENKKSAIWQPLVNCIWCMPSIHSLAGYGLAVGIGVITVFSWHLVFMYPLVVMGSSFLSGFLYNLNECTDMASLYFRNAGEKEYLEVKDKKKAYNLKNGINH